MKRLSYVNRKSDISFTVEDLNEKRAGQAKWANVVLYDHYCFAYYLGIFSCQIGNIRQMFCGCQM